MTYLLTALWAVPSGVFWFINAEAMVVVQVKDHPDLAPWSIALAATLGQMVGYALLYLFAGFFLARFGFVRRAVARYRERWAARRSDAPERAGPDQTRQVADPAPSVSSRTPAGEAPDRAGPDQTRQVADPAPSVSSRTPAGEAPDRAGPATCLVFASGGLMGLPPLLALFAIYGSARVGPVQTLVLSAAPFRFVWYLGWAYGLDYLRDTFGWFAG